MSYLPLNNITAPDAYNAAAQIIGVNSVRLRLLVNNQAVYYQLGHGNGGGTGIRWDLEQFLPPGFYGLDINADAIQVRAAIPAASIPTNQSQAQITASLLTAQDVSP